MKPVVIMLFRHPNAKGRAYLSSIKLVRSANGREPTKTPLPKITSAKDIYLILFSLEAGSSICVSTLCVCRIIHLQSIFTEMALLDLPMIIMIILILRTYVRIIKLR